MLIEKTEKRERERERDRERDRDRDRDRQTERDSVSTSEKESVIRSSFCVLEGQYFHYLILLCLEVKRLTTNHHVLFFGIHSTYVQAKGKIQCRMFGLLHIVVSPMFFFL